MAGRIDAPAKCELRSVIRFLLAGGWFVEKINAAVSSQTSRRLRRAILTSGMAPIHEDARPHSADVTQQLLEQFKWGVFDHPTFGPDLVTSDFHLFLQLENWLGSQSSQKNEEIQSKVKTHLTSLVATFFEEGIGSLIHRYDKCLNLQGDYVKSNHV
ncbi:hypothetical protein AVEN_195095-1 [Araneus ventricosus]|uniref:Histone-lysine N-methyltransferase SETMAR n=1 Tax=Araneus ventricosus TaxID=182803 RepID=A0A4Y2BHJ1_ARAVE|nr:hypothetical protein AVEN_195095-1 [Araneus ventricosus]